MPSIGLALMRRCGDAASSYPGQPTRNRNYRFRPHMAKRQDSLRLRSVGEACRPQQRTRLQDPHPQPQTSKSPSSETRQSIHSPTPPKTSTDWSGRFLESEEATPSAMSSRTPSSSPTSTPAATTMPRTCSTHASNAAPQSETSSGSPAPCQRPRTARGSSDNWPHLRF